MKNSILDRGDVVWNSFNALGQKFMSFVPNLFGALILLIIAVLLAAALRKLVVRSLQKLRLDDRLKNRIPVAREGQFEGAMAPSYMIGQLVYWVVILVFLVTIAETLGWQVVSQKTSELIGYLPKLFSALLIFIIGYYIADFVRKALDAGFGSMSMGPGKALSRAVFIIMMIFVSLTAMDQAGVDITLLTANIAIIIGAIMLAFSAAFAFAAKGILQNILSFLYSKQRFEVGQHIRIGDVEGEIIDLDHMHMVIRSGGEDIIIPTRELTEKQIRLRHSKEY